MQIDISIPALRNGGDIPALCIQIFRVGDFFLLEGLKKKATAELESHIQNVPTLLDDETADGHSPKWLNEILTAIEDAYKDRSTAPTRDQLLKFTCLNRNKIFRFKDAVALLDKIPEMGRDLMKTCITDDSATLGRPREFRLGLPVLAAVERPDHLYAAVLPKDNLDGSRKMPCLLYPVVECDIVFITVDPETDKEVTTQAWMTPDASQVQEIFMSPESEIVRVLKKLQWRKRFSQVLTIRFDDCDDARLYVERYCNADPSIKKRTLESAKLMRMMRTEMVKHSRGIRP